MNKITINGIEYHPVKGAVMTCDEQSMTLRDYFAAKAMQAHCQALSSSQIYDRHKEVARLAYLTADAMLNARVAAAEVGKQTGGNYD